MIVGSRQDALNAAALVSDSHGGARLIPQPLTDGRYALPESTLTDPGCAAANSLLSTWSVETVAGAAYMTTPEGYPGNIPLIVMVGDKTCYQTGRPAGLTMPHADVFRFEARTNDFAGEFDYGWPSSGGVNKRRNQFVAFGANRGCYSGDTIWQSFCFIPGDLPGYPTSSFGRIVSWHSVDYGTARSGIVGLDAGGGNLEIFTRSSASTWPETGNGIPVSQYSTTVPAKGTKTYVVMQMTFGETGHLNAWINGSQVVDADTPIGYYGDLVAHPGAELGFPTFGTYSVNQPTTDILYLANIEWGTTDLSTRIATPLSVPDLTW